METTFTRTKLAGVIAALSVAAVTAWIFLALFQPKLGYRIQAPAAQLESPEYWRMLETVSDSRLQPNNKIQVIANGENFYPAELAAIAQAKHSVNVEAYIFHKGEVTKRFVDALAERARNGVKVKMVIDAVGSTSTNKGYFKPLTDAGGEVNWYHPLRWHSWDRVNNRTHRELIIIDGAKAFIGGAGFADHWLHDKDKSKRWRDTMVFVEGPVVTALQGSFVENWLESSGEVITGTDYFPILQGEGSSAAMVVNSSASKGRSTRARMLFQTLIASAKSSIYMNTPYFLPDDDARNEIIKAAKRGVSVKIITPGKESDHFVTRSSSRRLYGDLLSNGVQIYEYQPSMIHVKALIVDRKWSVVGSTNIDNRSFELNDELNLAAFDGMMAQRLTQDFMQDLQSSKLVTYEDWKRRPLRERFTEFVGGIFERQQ
jgi:cardiolipin synthase